MSIHLPIEIIRHIIEYCPMIDIRRSFNIYRKLHWRPYEEKLQHAFIRDKQVIYDNENGVQIIYDLYNKIDRPKDIPNDKIHILCVPLHRCIQFEIDIFKFKPKTFREEDRFKESEFFYPVGDYGFTHYWNAYMHEYRRY